MAIDPAELDEAVGGSPDLEAAFVHFLHEQGH